LSANGSSSTRTAGSVLPPISTSPTPSTWAMRWLTMFETVS
jgi:hypothetical protein